MSRYFGLSDLGKALFGWEKAVDGKRAHWMKLPLDFFNHPAVIGLPDSQRLPLINVGLLCLRRNNLVKWDPVALRKSCNSRVKPDLDLYLSEGLIEATQIISAQVGAIQVNSVQIKSSPRNSDQLGANSKTEHHEGQQLPHADAPGQTSDSVRGERRREREGEKEQPAFLPAAFRAEKAIYDSRAQAETALLKTVSLLADRLGRDPPGVMVEVTSYQKADGTVVKGRENPAQLGSVERVKKSLEDAVGWLADLESGKVVA